MTRLTVLAFSVLAFLGAWYLRGCTSPAPTSTTTAAADTVFVDRPLLRRDTVRVSVPDRVTVYRTVTETRVDTVRIPVDLTDYRVTTPRPLNLGSRTATLTLFNPSTSAWEQQTYHVPERNWGFNLSASVLAMQTAEGTRLSVGPSASLRYRRLTLNGAYLVTPDGSGVPSASLSYALMKW